LRVSIRARTASVSLSPPSASTAATRTSRTGSASVASRRPALSRRSQS
jgi:hypothetical protein